MITSEQIKTILLVEDEGVIALSEARMLQKYGYKVITAYSGAKAIEAVQSSPEIDLVLMDINLGEGLDGTQAAEVILAQRELPVIFLSSHTDPEIVEKTEGITSYGYLVKGSGETVINTSIKMAFRLFQARIQERQKEDALTESKANLLAILENTDDIICLRNREHRILFYNSAFARVVKELFNVEAFIGMRTLDCLPADEQKKWLPVLNRVLDGEKYKGTFKLDFGVNDVRFYEISFQPIKKDGKVIGYSEFNRDITERKQAEDAVRESEAKYQLVFENSGTANSIFDRECRLILQNTLSAQYLGTKPGEALGKTTLEVFGPERGPTVTERMRRVLDSGVTEAYETSFNLPDGEKWFRSVYQPIFDGNHLVVGIQVVSQDITENKAIEGELREIKERYDYTTMVGKVGTWDWQIPTGALVWNDETYRLLGLVPGSITPSYELYLEFVHPDDREFLDASVNAAWYEKKLYSLDCRIVREGGQEIVCHVTGKVEFDSSDKPIRMLGTIQDITERKHTEDALRENEARLKTVMENTPDTILWVDQAGLIKFVNRLVPGLDAAEVIGSSIYKWVPEEQHPVLTRTFEKVFSKGEYGHYESLGPGPNGEARNYDVRVSPVLVDGKVVSAIYTARDITERVQVAVTLARQRQRLDFIIQGTNAGTWEWNVQTGETMFNERWAEMIGYTLEEISPVSIDTWIKYAHPDDLKLSNEMLKKHFRGESSYYEFESRMLHKNGDWVCVLDRGKVAVWTEDGKPLWMFGTHQDITDRKRAEDALQKAVQDKQGLLKELQHRAKNSFAMIVSLTNLMADTPRSDECRATLTDLGERVRAMSELYDLLYNTESVMETQLDQYFTRITIALPSSKHIRLKQDYDPLNVPVRVAAPLGLILTELLTNAIKHAFPADRHGMIGISLRKNETNALLEVADNGIGLPEDFDISSSESLGLMLVHSLVQQIRGTFHVDRELGTRCVIEFPL